MIGINGDVAAALAWAIAAIAFFSYLGAKAWVNAQRREREAYYRAEAIKKIAEIQGEPPEPVMALLREALKPPPEQPSARSALLTPGQAREFYRGEMMKRMAELRGSDADAVLALMREDEKRSARRVREGLKLAGLISAGVGAGLMVFLRAMLPDMPAYLAGMIPLLVGCALLVYALIFPPGE